MDSFIQIVMPKLQWILENKWSIVFIIFGILVAFSIGQQLAGNNKEYFEGDEELIEPPEKEQTRCEKQAKMYADNKLCKDCDETKKTKISKKKKIASASCPQMPDMSKYVLKEDVPNLSEYIHKSLVPNMSNYITKSELEANYMLKSACKMDDDEESSDEEETVAEFDVTINGQCGNCGQTQSRCYCNTPYREVQIPTCNKKSEKVQTKAEMKKTEDELTKNKDNMDVTYTDLDKAFTGCNLAICGVNNKPNGLTVKKTS